MNLTSFFKSKGYDIKAYNEYNKHIDEWKEWYKGYVSNFHKYKVYNGVNHTEIKRYSLQLAKSICEDWANLIMNERVEFVIGDGKSTQEQLHEILDRNDFYVLSNQAIEKSFALGTGAFVVTIGNLYEDSNTGVIDVSESEVNIEFITADKIYPLSWSNGKITEVAFVTQRQIGNETYCFISMHTKNDNGNYMIRNYVLKEKGGRLIDETEKASNVIQEFDTGSNIPWFSIISPNISNNIHLDSPYGVSIYANSIHNLKALDVAYDSLVNEFSLGRKRIFVRGEAMRYDTEKEKLVFDQNDAVFYSLPKDLNSEDMISESDMTLRVEEHNTGIQFQLNLLSMKVGFGEKHYNFDSGSIQTATQIVSENSSLFRTLKKHEIVVENALVDLFKAIIYAGTNFSHYSMQEQDITINFDDSIIEDKNSEMQRDLVLVNSGIMSKLEYRVKWFNETEEEAKAKLPQEEVMQFGVM